MSLASWIGIHERPEGFRLTEDQTHWARKGLVFAGLAGGYCENSLRFQDSSSFKNHGTLTSMAVPASATSGWVWDNTLGRWGCAFDGSNDYISMPAGVSVAGLAEASFACWFRPTAVPASGNAAVWWESTTSSGYSKFALFHYTNGDLVAVGRDSNTGSAYIATATNPFTAGSLYHCAMTYSSITDLLLLYINGVQVASNNTAKGVLYAAAPNNPMAIGAFISGDSYYINGKIFDPCLSARALAVSEIAALADPSNVMLSGLLLPPQRRIWGAVTVAPAVTARGRILSGVGNIIGA